MAIFDPAIFDGPRIFDTGPCMFDEAIFDPAVFDTCGEIIIIPPQLLPGAGGGGGRRRRQFEYERAYLAEYAEALRRAVARRDEQRAAELAEEIVEIAHDEPALVMPQAQLVVETASKLQQLEALDRKMQVELAQLLVLRARAVDQALEEDDAEVFLVS
jgi:hypothetical protein